MRTRGSNVLFVFAALFGLCASSGCGVQQAVDSAIQNGINQAAGQFGGIDVQGFVNSYLAGQESGGQ